jgi:hypothetical protein
MILFAVVLFGTVNLFSFSVPGRHHRDRHRLGVRRPVNWQQRTPHSPNNRIQAVHQIALTPIAICFQFAPSLIARHGTLPVPPALK